MQKPVVIVGGGLAGLACARALQDAGVPFLLFEATDRVGGRVKTDVVEGFRLDRGFQVHFSAYPYAGKVLDEKALKFRKFEAGAMIYHDGKLNKLQQPTSLGGMIEMVRSPFLSLFDKLKLRRWNTEVEGMSVAMIRGLREITAEKHLRNLGFSDDFLDRFARPFFGGVFLDRSLQVSKRQFTFVWKMLVDGDTVLPELGMEEIPKQLAADLPQYLVREYSRVEEILKDSAGRASGVRLDTNEVFEASAVIVATDSHSAAELTGIPTPIEGKHSICLYFETATPCVDGGAFLVLNGTGQGIVNEVAPLSSVSSAYAPANKHLCSVTILGEHSESDEELAEIAKKELTEWFPTKGVYMWRFIRAYRIRNAQMTQEPGFGTKLPKIETDVPGLFLAGEFTTNSSLDGAIESGLKAAGKVIAGLPELTAVS
ncbi:MAG: protoporphyrinogen/coproporphyrinogen oxidase [Fimbriimonas sp.]